MKWRKTFGCAEWSMKSRAGNFTIKWNNDKSVYRASLNGKPTNFFANDLAAVQHMVERQIRTDEEEDPWGRE